MSGKIIQIIPTENWWAVFEDNGELNINRIVCWGIIEEVDEATKENFRYVVGFISVTPEGVIDSVDVFDNFLFYVYGKDELEALRKAKEIFKIIKKRDKNASN